MRISNIQRAKKFKRIFFLVSVVIAITSLIFFLTDYTLYGILSVIAFSIWFLYFHVADYYFIQYNDENNKISLRYFKVIRFGKGEYNSIEFPQQILKMARFENTVFGKLSDLTLFVKTKRGIAEYPTISFSALSKADRKKIQKSLNKVLDI